jgi:hypothetical protein
MRGLILLCLAACVATPALAGGHAIMHDRMTLPTSSPAFETSDGDRYGKFAVRPKSPPSDLERFASRIGLEKGRADFFRVSPDESGSTAVAGTVSNGAVQLQFRWTPN